METIEYGAEVETAILEVLNERYFKVCHIDRTCSFLGRYKDEEHAANHNDMGEDDFIFSRLELLERTREYASVYTSLVFNNLSSDEACYFAELSGGYLSFIGKFDYLFEAEKRASLIYKEGTVLSILGHNELKEQIMVYLESLLDFSVPLFGHSLPEDISAPGQEALDFFLKLLSGDLFYDASNINYELILGSDSLPWYYNVEGLDEYSFAGIELFVLFYAEDDTTVPHSHSAYVSDDDPRVERFFKGENEDEYFVSMRSQCYGEEPFVLKMDPETFTYDGTDEDGPAGFTAPLLVGNYQDSIFAAESIFG